jgi:hypothetical protein
MHLAGIFESLLVGLAPHFCKINKPCEQTTQRQHALKVRKVKELRLGPHLIFIGLRVRFGALRTQQASNFLIDSRTK